MKTKRDLISIYVMLNILFIFLGCFFCLTHILNYELLGSLLIIPFFTNLFISILIIWYYKFVKKKYKFNILDILVLLLCIFAIISTIFAYRVDYAIMGSPERYEGIIAIIYYLTLFYITSFIKKENKKKIAYLILFTGVVQAVIGFLQMIESPLVEKVTHRGDIWAVGFTGNPNFFGSYMTLSIGFAIGLFVDEKNKNIKWILGIIIGIITVGLLVSDAMSAIVGLFTILVFTTIYCINNKKIKEIIIIVTIFLSLLLVLHFTQNTKLVKDIVKTKNETVEIAKGNINDSYGTHRIEIWKRTIEKVPNYLLHGVGIDNYLFVFDGGSLKIKESSFDKAHNELLQILITQGIFCFICYVTFYGIIVVKGIKYTFKKKEIYLLLPVVGYLVQAMFNISVIEVAPIFFISLGLLSSEFRN